MTRLLLVRHGETDANVSGTWQGSTDSDLNDRGRAQAAAIANRLQSEARKIDVIYTSPLGRAMETARIISDHVGNPPTLRDPNLAEFHLGDWEGLTYDELRFEKRLWDQFVADPNFAPPGGESAIEFGTRLITSLQTIAQTNTGKTVLVVSHGGAISTALSVMVGQDGSRWQEYQMANCALSELTFTPKPILVCLNEKSHLHSIGALAEWD